MKKKLRFKQTFTNIVITVISLIAIQAFGQNISTPTVIENAPLKVSFDLTNGNGSLNYFKTTTQYSYELSPGGLVFGNFSVNNPPVSSNGASQTGYEKTVYAPIGTAAGVYSIRVNATNPIAQSGFSNSFALFNDFEIEDLSSTGYIQCQTPATTYKVVTITNKGNITDIYDLSLNPNIAPDTEQILDSDILTLEGDPLAQTPSLLPGASYTFMIRFAAVTGTQPAKNNYTELIVTSQNDNLFSQTELIHTYTYCGNGNNIPAGPDSPDLKIVKSTNESSISVEETLKYTLTISNSSPKNALTPTILDTIPSNVEVVAYYKQASDTRNIIVSYDETTRLFQASYPTGGNVKFDVNSLPINVYIEVIPNCHAAPEVVNTAYVTNNAGDQDLTDNVSSALTEVVFDLSDMSLLGNWSGGTSNDWFDCANWSKGITPDKDISVTVSSGINPLIDSASPFAPLNGTAEVLSLTVMNGKSLTMNNTTLKVGGDWTNYGTFNPGNGTVVFNGSANDQTIFDVSQQTTFNNLKIATLSGLKVNIPDGSGLFVNNQLDLESGDLRLHGKAQLIQTHSGTNLNVTSGGRLLRDQLGQLNKYNYNYWSSPVGTGSSSYTIDAVMKDGTDPNAPQNINWTNGLNGLPGPPITVSTRWLYKFENLDSDYDNWTKINQNTSLNAGIGYTMKGVDLGDGTQNYTFTGIPFSGDINQSIASGKLILLGNPYPSALDAHQFLEDNEGVLDGELLFWDHFVTTNSHQLASYEGGYAVLTKTGENAAVSPSGQTSTNLPQRYIPVGQGFMAFSGNAGNIVFNNAQRAFETEDTTYSMTLFGASNSGFEETGDDEDDRVKRVRLGMVTPDNIHHPIMIGFMGDEATEAIDYGYDAARKPILPNEFYFAHPEAELLIQGVGHFDDHKIYPLGAIVKTPGRVSFRLNEAEHLDTGIPVYIYDNETQGYHNLRKSDYFVNLGIGVYNNRFSLRFKNHHLENSLDAQSLLDQLTVSYQNEHIIIANPSEQITITGAQLFNVPGQQTTNWQIKNGKENRIELAVRKPATGIYIVQVQTDNGVVSKKIRVN